MGVGRDLPQRRSTQRHVGGDHRGFADRDHRDLTDAYLERYFDALPGVWAERTMEIAQSITMGLFPMYSVEDSTIDRADRFLASDPSPAPCPLGGGGS